jgi:hypothetical protein
MREPYIITVGTPVSAVSVGALRNAAQEMEIDQIRAFLVWFGMTPIGSHALAFQGATLPSVNDSIAQGELNLKTATQLDKRLGEFALGLELHGFLVRSPAGPYPASSYGIAA